ncbi:MAG TPA: hypothetical protein VL325_11410, partial [Pyrinomonadaceae bacterium]|nr:hypothetical protein [Pyrinomonadaceae bacterium]
AIAEIKQAVELTPDDNELRVFLGSLYALVNNKEAALAQHRIIETQRPDLAKKLYQAIYGDKILVVTYDEVK